PHPFPTRRSSDLATPSTTRCRWTVRPAPAATLCRAAWTGAASPSTAWVRATRLPATTPMTGAPATAAWRSSWANGRADEPPRGASDRFWTGAAPSLSAPARKPEELSALAAGPKARSASGDIALRRSRPQQIGQFHGRLHLHLVEHAGAVDLHRPHADVELVGDQLVGQARHYQVHHVAFTVGEFAEAHLQVAALAQLRQAFGRAGQCLLDAVDQGVV